MRDWANSPAIKRWKEIRKESGKILRAAVWKDLAPLREAVGMSKEGDLGVSEFGWVCYNAGPGSMFWMPTQEDCEHELSDDIRPATSFEKYLCQRFGKKCIKGYEIELVR